MTTRKVVLAVAAIAAVWLWLVWLTFPPLYAPQAPTGSLGPARYSALPPPDRCRAPTEREQHRDRLVLEVMKTFRPEDPSSSLQHGTVRHFAQPVFTRRDDWAPCAPLPLFQDVASAAVAAGLFDGRYIGAEAIALARQIGPLDPRIVAAITRTAFYAERIASQTNADARVDARVVLAEFCLADRGLAFPVRDQVGADTPLGRATARIAIACGEPGALETVSALMTRMLAGTGTRVIDRATGDGLYDLAYALEMAGEAARPHAGPIIAMLDRDVLAPVPYYGLIARPPARLCSVAERIGGDVAAAARAKRYCTDESRGQGPTAPRATPPPPAP